MGNGIHHSSPPIHRPRARAAHRKNSGEKKLDDQARLRLMRNQQHPFFEACLQFSFDHSPFPANAEVDRRYQTALAEALVARRMVNALREADFNNRFPDLLTSCVEKSARSACDAHADAPAAYSQIMQATTDGGLGLRSDTAQLIRRYAETCIENFSNLLSQPMLQKSKGK